MVRGLNSPRVSHRVLEKCILQKPELKNILNSAKAAEWGPIVGNTEPKNLTQVARGVKEYTAIYESKNKQGRTMHTTLNFCDISELGSDTVCLVPLSNGRYAEVQKQDHEQSPTYVVRDNFHAQMELWLMTAKLNGYIPAETRINVSGDPEGALGQLYLCRSKLLKQQLDAQFSQPPAPKEQGFINRKKRRKLSASIPKKE